MAAINPSERQQYALFVQEVDQAVPQKERGDLLGRLAVTLKIIEHMKDQVQGLDDRDYRVTLLSGKQTPMADVTSENVPELTEYTADMVVRFCEIRAEELRAKIDVEQNELNEDLKKRAGDPSHSMWTCVGRKVDSLSGGYIYTFQFRNDYNPPDERAPCHTHESDSSIVYPTTDHEWDDKMDKAFNGAYPATQPDRWVADDWGFTDVESHERFRLFISGLGFAFPEAHCPDYTIDVPDLKTLTARWGRVKDDKGNGVVLPVLNLISSQGIAGHREYIEKSLDGLLVSDGAEFFHDMLIHVMTAVCRIYKFVGEIGDSSKPSSYAVLQEKTREVVTRELVRIDILKNLHAKAEKVDGISEDMERLVEHWAVLEGALAYYVDNIMGWNSYRSYYQTITRPTVGERLLHYIDRTPLESLPRMFAGTLPAHSPYAEKENDLEGFRDFIKGLWTTFEKNKETIDKLR